MPPTFQEHILDDHQDELLRFIFRKVNCPDTAQDIFQDTFVRYTNYPEKNKIENHRAFIFRIAANLVSDYERHNRVRERFHPNEEIDLDNLPQQDNRQPEQLVSQQERLQQLAKAVSALSPRCRDVFILIKFEELTYNQVAERLGISVSMVEKHLSHAIKALQQLKTSE
ncbi:MAG: RNA polymerase sigma factor [Methyloglobulus sp.]|nr:RNA polymerase sigma factor [Methyloglobulus sp.]